MFKRKISTMKKFWNEVVFNLMLQHKKKNSFVLDFLSGGKRARRQGHDNRRHDAQLKEISKTFRNF
jgi:cytoplasmic iron level regulating protein YaaA (DUF328/UPF0246 family)